MSKVLVAYFSASGVTENVALKVARAVDGDLFEIEPKIRYTAQDLDWRDKTSRSTIEMQDKKSRPEITHTADLSEYDTVVIGFPVWWYTAPTIINTFLESIDAVIKGIDSTVAHTSLIEYIFLSAGAKFPVCPIIAHPTSLTVFLNKSFVACVL